MGGRRGSSWLAVLAVGAGLAIPAAAGRDLASYVSPSSQGSTSSSQEGSSSSQKTHRHRTQVAEQQGPSPDLAKAEELIQQKDIAPAEALLQKVVQDDPSHSVGWFDLGVVENALG